MYRAKVICHSVAESSGIQLLSFEVEYPRIVLAEVVTHRTAGILDGDSYELAFAERTTTLGMSKNSASSRAIPLWKMVEKVMRDPYVPERFSLAGPGMQAAGYIEQGSTEYEEHRDQWLDSRNAAVVRALSHLNPADAREVVKKVPGLKEMLAGYRSLPLHVSRSLHKQDVNRLLEPFAWVTQVVTADQFALANFFALRCHKYAHPAFQTVARMMYLAGRESTPRPRRFGQWHLPFGDPQEVEEGYWAPVEKEPLPLFIKRSAARCAWVSYENHDRDGTDEAVTRTFDRLLAEVPVHASPVEHQATPDKSPTHTMMYGWSSNLYGWIQARKLVPMERIKRYEPSEEEITSWGPLPKWGV